MADNKSNPVLGCHSERFPSSWPGVSQPALPKNTPIEIGDEDDDELPPLEYNETHGCAALTESLLAWLD